MRPPATMSGWKMPLLPGHDQFGVLVVEDRRAVLVAEQVLVEAGQQVHRILLGAGRGCTAAAVGQLRA